MCLAALVVIRGVRRKAKSILFLLFLGLRFKKLSCIKGGKRVVCAILVEKFVLEEMACLQGAMALSLTSTAAYKRCCWAAKRSSTACCSSC